MFIKKDISVEEMVEKYPFTVRLLAEKGIRCIACGEPIWGTLEEACLEKGFGQEKIEAIVGEINDKIK
ncbi:MAG TPA: DUF1858 domain-containing protein [Saprospirales bacterium]|nr:DUF1858 domain-containing protein [Saprospirales bacterium]HAY71742.1 DUF1858 domain-containing protein [Saprospirales bacterium]HRQ30383.1 hypothetical protein [Saprospiraceae bacterium]